MKNCCENGIRGAKIKGGYKEAFNLMLETHKNTIEKYVEKLLF